MAMERGIFIIIFLQICRVFARVFVLFLCIKKFCCYVFLTFLFYFLRIYEYINKRSIENLSKQNIKLLKYPGTYYNTRQLYSTAEELKIPSCTS